ncbi:MAG TPA: hypothetical protein VJR23_09425 [Candidatus Acidoferrales bacterium]|nr:hypothetical protein [Candidatus Acidoferrales bacterium]
MIAAANWSTDAVAKGKAASSRRSPKKANGNGKDAHREGGRYTSNDHTDGDNKSKGAGLNRKAASRHHAETARRVRCQDSGGVHRTPWTGDPGSSSEPRRYIGESKTAGGMPAQKFKGKCAHR